MGFRDIVFQNKIRLFQLYMLSKKQDFKIKNVNVSFLNLRKYPYLKK